MHLSNRIARIFNLSHLYISNTDFNDPVTESFCFNPKFSNPSDSNCVQNIHRLEDDVCFWIARDILNNSLQYNGGILGKIAHGINVGLHSVQKITEYTLNSLTQNVIKEKSYLSSDYNKTKSIYKNIEVWSWYLSTDDNIRGILEAFYEKNANYITAVLDRTFMTKDNFSIKICIVDQVDENVNKHRTGEYICGKHIFSTWVMSVFLTEHGLVLCDAQSRTLSAAAVKGHWLYQIEDQLHPEDFCKIWRYVYEEVPKSKNKGDVKYYPINPRLKRVIEESKSSSLFLKSNQKTKKYIDKYKDEVIAIEQVGAKRKPLGEGNNGFVVEIKAGTYGVNGKNGISSAKKYIQPFSISVYEKLFSDKFSMEDLSAVAMALHNELADLDIIIPIPYGKTPVISKRHYMPTVPEVKVKFIMKKCVKGTKLDENHYFTHEQFNQVVKHILLVQNIRVKVNIQGEETLPRFCMRDIAPNNLMLEKKNNKQNIVCIDNENILLSGLIPNEIIGNHGEFFANLTIPYDPETDIEIFEDKVVAAHNMFVNAVEENGLTRSDMNVLQGMIGAVANILFKPILYDGKSLITEGTLRDKWFKYIPNIIQDAINIGLINYTDAQLELFKRQTFTEIIKDKLPDEITGGLDKNQYTNFIVNGLLGENITEIKNFYYNFINGNNGD